MLSVVSVQAGEMYYNLLIVLPREDCHSRCVVFSISTTAIHDPGLGRPFM